MEREGAHDLAAAYVLGALDEEERRAFDEHLATCQQCREEVEALGEVAAALAYAPEGPAPPEALRGRILEAAQADRGKVIPLARYRRRPVFLAAAAAAACLAIGLGLWATIGTSNGPGSAQTVALRGHVGTLSVKGSGAATLDVKDLTAPPGGAFYQVWVIPAHTSNTLADVLIRKGGPDVSVQLTRKLSPGDTVAVTVERKPVKAPTSTPIFQASLST